MKTQHVLHEKSARLEASLLKASRALVKLDGVIAAVKGQRKPDAELAASLAVLKTLSR